MTGKVGEAGKFGQEMQGDVLPHGLPFTVSHAATQPVSWQEQLLGIMEQLHMGYMEKPHCKSVRWKKKWRGSLLPALPVLSPTTVFPRKEDLFE